jgi:hypothetical protein
MNLFRSEIPSNSTLKPHYWKKSRRVPGNIPYVVDNLWEWKRPETFPSRQHSVFASPSVATAKKSGGDGMGKVFRVVINGQCSIVQIETEDARFHPDCKKLRKQLNDLLGPDWIESDLETKRQIAALWAPCLKKDEVESLFSLPPLAAIRQKIESAITLWDTARFVDLSGPPPFPKGEIWFEPKESWRLLPLD